MLFVIIISSLRLLVGVLMIVEWNTGTFVTPGALIGVNRDTLVS